MQYKQQLEVNDKYIFYIVRERYIIIFTHIQAQQAQRGINPAAMANQQANSQRLMRPVSTNNLGLRHLLQQVSTKYFKKSNFIYEYF